MASTPETTHLRSAVHMRVPFAELCEAGAYLNEQTGDLYRIPDDALAAGRSPVIEIVSERPTMMTKLSDNAWIPISKARQLAADADLNVAF